MLTEVSAGLKTGGSFQSRTSTLTVAVEVDTGPENGASFVTTTSRVNAGVLSKSSSLEVVREKNDVCLHVEYTTSE